MLQEVHVYVEASSCLVEKRDRWTCMILELVARNGKSGTMTGFTRQEATYNEAILHQLAVALSRINRACDLHIHTQNNVVMVCMENYLEKWSGNGYVNARGVPIKNADMWKEIHVWIDRHNVTYEHGPHPFLNWMKNELRHLEASNVDIGRGINIEKRGQNQAISARCPQ